MRCMVCERLSLSHICPECRESLLVPRIHKRKILGTIPVYSFFPYDEIEPFLLTKHSDVGYYVYSILSKLSLSRFAAEWRYENRVASVAVDDHVKSGYSHSAILNRALKSPSIIPRYGKLRATNPYKYAGKSFEERLRNPRRFRYECFEEEEVILVDDIVTTGATLSEAAETLHAERKKVILCLTLADAENK